MISPDKQAEIHAAVRDRYPDLTGPAFDRKVARVTAIVAHSNHGPTWTRKDPQ